MADTLITGRVFGEKKLDKIIVAAMMKSMPEEYPWMPTVPPCQAGWIQTKNDTEIF